MEMEPARGCAKASRGWRERSSWLHLHTEVDMNDPWYERNKEVVKERQRKRYREDADFRKRKTAQVGRSRRLRLYGVTEGDVKYLLFIQKGACAICKQSFVKTPHIDHDHLSKEVRGLLCGRCNTLLGLADENPLTLQRARDYLSGYRPESGVSREDFDRYFRE